MPHQTAQNIWKDDQSLSFHVYIVENDITLCSIRKFSCHRGKIVPRKKTRLDSFLSMDLLLLLLINSLLSITVLLYSLSQYSAVFQA
jgi:hypothetical protein